MNRDILSSSNVANREFMFLRGKLEKRYVLIREKPAEDTLVPPPWETGKKYICFFRIICSRCCTRRNLRFNVENCQHVDQEQLTRQ